MSSNASIPFGYNTHREEDREAMLASIGINDVDKLFSAIPKSLKLSSPLDLPAPLNEWQLEKSLCELAAKNATTKTHDSYLGGGAYEHYIPATIDAIVNRGEFLTSYTPYQPEISQGLLQSLFEYQTALAEITGLPVVNGSCYDGATALADAAWATCLISKQESQGKIIVSDGVWDHHKEVVTTYMNGRSIPISKAAINPKTGKTDLEKLDALLASEKPAGFLFQSPNAFGMVEDVRAIADICAKNQVVSVCSFNPLAAGLFTPPGQCGVDIVTCDGQPLGIPLSAGGPSLGVFATKKEYRKYVPGRLVGKVTDINGNLAYALVFEDREQHVARERATSNICSNQALNALRAVLYLSTVGDSGLGKIAVLNANKAHYLATELCTLDGVELATDDDFFNEFVISLPKAAEKILAHMQQQNIFAGIDYSGKIDGVENALLITVTEIKSKENLDRYVSCLREALATCA